MSRGTRIALLGAGALALGALVFVLAAGRPAPLAGPDTPPAQPPAPAAEPPAAPVQVSITAHVQPELTNKKSPVPLHQKSKYPPLTRFRFDKLPAAEPGKGITFPDGTTLPYLNGMTWAPMVSRSRDVAAPIPPVIGLVVDQEGFEWYEHADHSTTTTRYKQVTFAGETYWDPATEHAAPRKSEHLIPADAGTGSSR
jgi:hypothetical protein